MCQTCNLADQITCDVSSCNIKATQQTYVPLSVAVRTRVPLCRTQLGFAHRRTTSRGMTKHKRTCDALTQVAIASDSPDGYGGRAAGSSGPAHCVLNRKWAHAQFSFPVAQLHRHSRTAHLQMYIQNVSFYVKSNRLMHPTVDLCQYYVAYLHPPIRMAQETSNKENTHSNVCLASRLKLNQVANPEAEVSTQVLPSRFACQPSIPIFYESSGVVDSKGHTVTTCRQGQLEQTTNSAETNNRVCQPSFQRIP